MSSVVAFTTQLGEHSPGFADNYQGSTTIPFKVVAGYTMFSVQGYNRYGVSNPRNRCG